jgi:glycosyltransferase involved in cell wall biosynthesis
MAEVSRRADYIIAVSESSRQDCLSELRIGPERANRVCAVSNGVSDRFMPPAEGPAPRRNPADKTTTRTCLYVGRADPYKNLGGLLRAFAQVHRELPFPLELAIAGPRDDRYPEAPALARELGVESHVVWTGYLSDTELVRRYQTADLLVLPSRYEGFGLPVVEAMACGTPVLCSTAAALREIAGEAALFSDPDDIADMARRMREILTQPDLAARLARDGLRQAARFTWTRTATQTLAVYHRAAALPEKG